jgi:hypothetical protein
MKYPATINKFSSKSKVDNTREFMLFGLQISQTFKAFVNGHTGTSDAIESTLNSTGTPAITEIRNGTEHFANGGDNIHTTYLLTFQRKATSYSSF